MQFRAVFAAFFSIWILLPFLPVMLAQKKSALVLAVGVYLCIVASIFCAAVFARPIQSEGRIPPPPRIRRAQIYLFFALGPVLVCFHLAVVLRIMAERGQATWLPIQDVSQTLAEKLSPWLPALRDLPDDLAWNRFSQNAALVTDSYALAYTGALISLLISLVFSVWLLLRYFGRRELAAVTLGFDSQSQGKRVMAFFGWFIIVGVYVLNVFISTNVKIGVMRKELFPHFETSEMQLYFRILLGTGLATAGFSAFLWYTALILSVLAARFIHTSPASSPEAIE